MVIENRKIAALALLGTTALALASAWLAVASDYWTVGDSARPWILPMLFCTYLLAVLACGGFPFRSAAARSIGMSVHCIGLIVAMLLVAAATSLAHGDGF